jgi:hypothetical protein
VTAAEATVGKARADPNANTPLGAGPFDCDGAVVAAPLNENDIGAAVPNADGGATVVPESKMTIVVDTRNVTNIYKKCTKM